MKSTLLNTERIFQIETRPGSRNGRVITKRFTGEGADKAGDDKLTVTVIESAVMTVADFKLYVVEIQKLADKFQSEEDAWAVGKASGSE